MTIKKSKKRNSTIKSAPLKKSYDIICVGSATVDVFAHTDKSELIKILNPAGEKDLIAYPSGSKMLITEIDFTIGGGGTNTSTSLARLGRKTAFLGRLGNDENSSRVLSFLNEEGIGFVGQMGKKMGGYSVILDSREHDRTILTYKGANDHLEYSKLDQSKLSTSWFYFCSMMGQSLRALELLALFARRKKARIMFNPSSYLVCHGLHDIQNILKYTDILVCNKEEAELMIGCHQIDELFKRLCGYVPLVVITDGKNGSYASDGKILYTAGPLPIRVVECTGAGDAFGSTFLWGYLQKKDISYALSAATVNASSVLLHHGAKNNLLRKDELLMHMKRKKVKIQKKKLK